MKKIYFSFIAATLLVITVSAQSARDNTPQQAVQYTTEYVTAPRVDGAMQSFNRDAGDTIWIDGFEDPGNWEFIPPSGTPDPEENGWSIGNESNSWWTTQAMDTEGNYARFVNGDPTVDPPTHIEDGPFIYLYDGTIDLTGVPAPHLEFEQFGARFITHQAVQVSTDGGDNWVTAGSNDEIDPLTAAGGSAYPNTQTRRFNITSAVSGDPSNVMIRLYWDGLINGPNMNYIEYGWFVDNIRIVEGSTDDLTLTFFDYQPDWDIDIHEVWRDLPYTIFPFSQLRDIYLTGHVTNNGAEEQTGVMLEVVISEGGSEVANLSSDPITLAPNQDTVLVIPYTPPAVAGEYDLMFEVVSDSEDFNPEDNVGSASFEVSSAIYARDNGILENSGPANVENVELQVGGGNGFYFSAQDEVHCLGVALGEGSDETIFFTGYLHEVQTADFNAVAETETTTIANIDAALNAEGGDEFTWLSLFTPFEVFEGDEYIASFEYFSEVGGGEILIGTSGSSPDVSSWVWGPMSSTDVPCDPCYTSPTYMVRVGMTAEFCLIVGTEEPENVTGHSLYPNPTAGQTTMEYTLLETANVQLILFDQNGRIVMQENKGKQTIGEYRLDYNFSDLAAGMYTFSIQVGDKAINKKLIIK